MNRHSEIVLNPQQQAAIEFGELNTNGQFVAEPLLIIAGAGTGKTNTLAHRVAHLINHQVDPERILLMTFSRRAANELVERTRRIVLEQLKVRGGNDAHLAAYDSSIFSLQIPWMGTFHSIANRLLRQFGKSLGMAANFTIIDRNDAEDLLDVLRHELGFSSLAKRFPKKSVCLNIYSRCVNAQLTLESIVKQDFPWCEDWVEKLGELFALYAERKIQQQTLDYDDLLLYWYHLMDIPEVTQLVRSQFDHLLIDEYQDTNILQAGIVSRLFPDGRGVTVVGDDAQSIYSFRSAEIDNILNFPEQFTPPAKVIQLIQNYRSTQPILDLSNQLLAESKTGYTKELISDKSGSNKPKLVTVEDALSQAKYIIEKVLAAREGGIELRRQAVLFRSAHHSDQLEIELMRHDIPFVKYGGLKFLEAAHVKDLLSIIRWSENPKHRISGFRLLKMLPAVGPGTAKKALDFLELNGFDFSAFKMFTMPAAATESWQKLTAFLIGIQSKNFRWPEQMEIARQLYQPLLDENYEDNYARNGDIEQLVNIAQQYPSCESFISELTLDPPRATGGLSAEAHRDDDFLILSTVHSAKGQEWQNVFILNVTDGNFPNEYATSNPKSLEEERRLLNVAITRAKQELHLIQPLKHWLPEQPKYGDKHVYGAKSRFLTDKVVAKLHSIYWPERLAMVAEPTTNYQVFGEISAKIRRFW